MEYVEITEENVKSFYQFIDIDNREELKRSYFRAIGAMDEAEIPRGVIVYEVENSETGKKDTRSRIHVLAGESDAIKDGILIAYKKNLSYTNVTESYYETADEKLAQDLEARGFSKKVGEASDLIVSVKDIKTLIDNLKINKMPPYVKSLSEVTILQYRLFVKKCLANGYQGLLEDLAYLPQNWFELNLSSCIMEEDKIQGGLFFRRTPSGLLIAKLYSAFGKDYKKKLMYLLAFSALRSSELYPDETKIVIRRSKEYVKELMAKLFKGAVTDSRYFGTRKEIFMARK